ncbi:MAG: pyridoxal phosphate-dependent aminotransferase [Acidobacteriota bacterium]
MSRVGESATGRITRREHELRAEGRSLVGFGAGEPHFVTPPKVQKAAHSALDAGLTRYTAVAGLPDLREQIARRFASRYGAPWERDHVIATVGAKAALLELALVLFDEGDEVLIPSPCWVSLPEQVRLAGGEAQLVTMERADGFTLRARPLIERMSPSTRAVLLNSPCNPTGARMSAVEMEQLVEACAERQILLISDETYECYVYDGEHVSASQWAGSYPETVVVVGSFSKTWAMTGWRLGWAAGPSELIAQLGVVQSHATSNPTTFVMHAALEALAEPEDAVRARVGEYRRRRDQMVDGLQRLPGITCSRPSGAFYIFADVGEALVRRGLGSAAGLAEVFLEEAGVVVVPGEAFGDERSLRLSYACSSETLGEGLERLAEVLAS